ncbi:uncharacterized protein [Lepeophtheirus salmonis]|uniref:uncharacterized protein n=1 Tax=Lepeophtheirus salmonis TaxID=72036 RepID=UPI001AE83B66|nr:uncharacterized protein LOC121130862 [Lepeophtheirus salmonis]
MSVISASMPGPRGVGTDFYNLVKGAEKSYSCSYLINLDPDLLGLCADEDRNALDMARDALISHTNRIFSQVIEKSGRDLNQFCFGTTFLTLNSNYKKLDHMDPMTWKKEGITQHWSGKRGFRKACCKVCCTDKVCIGCTKDKGCYNAPIRGCYDGLVVLTAITKESLPNQYTVIPPGASIHDVRSRRARQELDKRLDQEDYAMTLEGLLTAHYQYGGEMDMANKAVTSHRMSIILGEVEDMEKRKSKKYPAYAIYVAYRLESEKFRNNEMVGVGKFYKLKSSGPVAKMLKESTAVDTNKVLNDENIRGISEVSIPIGDSGGGDASIWEASERMEYDDIDRRTSFGGLSRDLSRASGKESDYDDVDGMKGEDKMNESGLISRVDELETENSRLFEIVMKLEHGKTWTENRLDSLQSEVNEIRKKLQMPIIHETEDDDQ